MTFGSVCSGIEAVSIAWLPLGYRAAWVAEIDPFPCAVLAHRYPETPNLGDFTTIGVSAEPIDVLVGGTPCQSFSVAGLRKGMADARGNLALEFLRLAQRLRAPWVVWENVPGVLSSNGGRDFGAFLRGLAELGYGFAYRVLDAQYVRVDGFGRAVPQRRRRVFVVGCLGDWRRAAAILFERESLSGNPAPGRTAGAGVAGCLDARTSGGGFPGTDGACDGHVVAQSLNARGRRLDGDSETFVAHTLRADGFDAGEDGTGRGTPIVPWAVREDNQNGATLRDTAGSLHADAPGTQPCGTLILDPMACQCHGNNVGPMGTLQGGNGNEAGGVPFLPVAFTFDERNVTSGVNRTRVGPELPCGTLHEQPHAVAFQERGRDGGRNLEWQPDLAYSLNAPAGGGRRQELNVLWRWAVRRLTPRECERLQGFPGDWTLVPYRGKSAPDGPRYKAVGNSMAVNVMRWIGWRILLVTEAS